MLPQMNQPKPSPLKSRSTRHRDNRHTNRSDSNSNSGSQTVTHAANKFIQILKAKRNKDTISTTGAVSGNQAPFADATHLDLLFKKQQQANTNNSRKEAVQVLEFVENLLPGLQGANTLSLAQTLQEVIKFSQTQLTKLLKAERRDFHDLFSKILDLKSEERALTKKHLKSLIEEANFNWSTAKTQIQTLTQEVEALRQQNEMLSPKKKSKKGGSRSRRKTENQAQPRNSVYLRQDGSQKKGDQTNRNKLGTTPGGAGSARKGNLQSSSEDDSEDDEAEADAATAKPSGGSIFTFPSSTGITGPNKTAFDAMKSEMEVSLRRFQAKERDYIAKLNMMQQRLEKMKNINLGLIEKYNIQTDKLNRFKHRLIFHIRKIDPHSDMLNDEEMIDADMVKAIEQNNASLDNNSMLSGQQEVEEAIEQREEQKKAKQQAQGGMEAIEQQDKFDYSIIYRRRHITKKSHSQRKNPRAYDTESKTVKYYKRLVRTAIAGSDTKGLIPLMEHSTQTVISLADRKYDHFLQNQYDVELLAKRATFEKEIEKHINDHRRMCFLNDGIMRRLLLLSKPNIPLTDEEQLPVEQSELARELKEHEINFHVSEEEYNEKLKRANVDIYFKLENLDQYMDHKLKLPVSATDTILKYVFLSYIFATYSGKKKLEIIQRKEDQVSLLYKLCKQYRARLLEYDAALKKSQDNFQTFIQIHKGCGINHITNDFRFERTTTSNVNEIQHGNNTASLMISNIINRIKKLKVVMKAVTKKYFSFKVVYQKVYGFFQTRASEVEYMYDSNKVKHAHNIEEHFFRYLTERESGVKKIEEKIKNFIITIFNMDYCPKVEMLMRFMNLAKEMPFTKSEEFYYLRLIEYIKSESRGLDVPVEAHKGTNYIPFDKLEIFLNKYILWKLNPKIQAQIFKEFKDEIVTSYEGVSKKGVIDIDVAMLIVFKYINTKITYPYSKEYSYSLYELLDLDNVDGLTFPNFLEMYCLFNLNFYGEGTRLLAKVKSPQIKKELTIEEMMEQVGARPDSQHIEKPWMEKNYIYSSNQLKEIFCKFTKQEFKEDQEPTSKLEAFPFHEMINEYENLIDFEKIYGFLGIQGSHVETEFYTAIINFKKNEEGFSKFIDSCLVKDDDWKDLYRRKLNALHYIFGNSRQFEEAVKAYTDSLIENNIESMDEDKRRSNVMLKSLLLYKIFQLELLKADFEQRFDYAQLEELPFN